MKCFIVHYKTPMFKDKTGGNMPMFADTKTEAKERFMMFNPSAKITKCKEA